MYDQYENRIKKLKRILDWGMKWKWVELTVLFVVIGLLVYVLLPEHKSDGESVGDGVETEEYSSTEQVQGTNGRDPAEDQENDTGEGTGDITEELQTEENQLSDAGGPISSMTIRLKTNYQGDLYLREKSYGDYSGKGFFEAKEYAFTDGGVSSINYAGLSFEKASTAYQIAFDSGSGAYGFSTYYSEDFKGTNSDVYTGVENEKLSFSFVSMPDSFNFKTESIPDRYREEEEAYRKYVYEHFLAVPENTRAALEKLARENHLDKNSKTILGDVRAYVRNAATYNLSFEKYPENEDMVAYFLSGGKEGVCQQYAAAATMMYRVMGIPARYTVGYLAKVEGIDDWETVDGYSHAWTEIYLDRIGWIAVDATGSSFDDLDLNLSGESGINNDEFMDSSQSGADPGNGDVPEGTEGEEMSGPIPGGGDGAGGGGLEGLGNYDLIIAVATRNTLDESDQPLWDEGDNDWVLVSGTIKPGERIRKSTREFYGPFEVVDSAGQIKDYSIYVISSTLPLLQPSLVIHVVREPRKDDMLMWYITEDTLPVDHHVRVRKMGGYGVLIQDKNGIDVTDQYKITIKETVVYPEREETTQQQPLVYGRVEE